MYDTYAALVTALKTLEQTAGQAAEGEEPETVTLPMAEDGWNARPDTVSYGIVRLDFESGALRGDDIKLDTAYEGSVDLYSLERSGAGWVEEICKTLTAYCDGAWSLNHHTYERETSLFHWEWVFQVEE